jgi:hypothetical protein
MSNITTDFINATKKIHADVRTILTTLRVIGNDVKAIHDGGISAEKDHDISSLHSAKHHANTYETKQYALDKLRFNLEKVTFRVGKWTLVILAIYTLFSGYQSCQTERAAKAAEIAAEAASGQLITMQKQIELGGPISVFGIRSSRRVKAQSFTTLDRVSITTLKAANLKTTSINPVATTKTNGGDRKALYFGCSASGTGCPARILLN